MSANSSLYWSCIFFVSSNILKPNQEYLSLFLSVLSWSRLFLPHPAYSTIFKLITVYIPYCSSLFMPLPAYSSLFQAYSSYSSLFQTRVFSFVLHNFFNPLSSYLILCHLLSSSVVTNINRQTRTMVIICLISSYFEVQSYLV